MSAYFLETSRLGFRHWKEEDLPLALELWGDSQVTKYIDGRGELSDEEVLDKLVDAITMLDRHGVQYWPIFLLVDDRNIGCGGLRPYEPKDGVLEMGIHISARHWRKGYATEASRAVMTYAFDTLRCRALFAGHNPKNQASQNLLKKLGFLYTHDEFYEPTGLKHPSYLMTREVYESVKG